MIETNMQRLNQSHDALMTEKSMKKLGNSLSLVLEHTDHFRFASSPVITHLLSDQV